MFSSALKSFTSNISSNYTLSPQPSSYSGPWKIFDAKKKSTGKPASVFVFDKKSLEAPGGGSLGGRSGASGLKRAQDEVVERLKKEASSLARLRHPSILELVEPVEETRGGGLMFATEPVTASLAGLLLEKDEQEKAGGVGGRRSRYVVEEADGQKRRRELEIDELEIQKGLLQIGKGLEFLHESAGLVHGNLTPDAIFINAKSDWKISGLGFSGPAENSNKPTSAAPISLSEVLNYDPRLPRHVQLNLDYSSPDFVIDGNVTSAADMFSLGMLIIALYNSPHRSPLEFNGSQSSYKRAFSSSSSVPSQSNNFMCSQQLPRDVVSGVLPRLITRRPAQRLDAREFQQAQYFDNILVSSIRFLDSLPAKTPNEKSQFMRGLPRILNQFPKSVLEKKLLPALLDEMKDRELLSLILQNIFKIVTALPAGKRVFTEKVIPRLREIFLSSAAPGKGGNTERDSAKEAGLMVLLENMSTVADNSSGKEFKDDVLPIIHYALESPTHSLVDASLRTLPVVLPILDFSTIKNELFPVIATVFAKTSSMGIKIRGLEALKALCGGSNDPPVGDGLTGIEPSKTKNSNVSILDKYTIQEKVVPLLKAIKTKEPAVMISALDVFKEVGKHADFEFLALEVLPILWQFSLGPLLNLEQFQAFMQLIKSLSSKVEQEQTRKLQELSSSNAPAATARNDFINFGGINLNGSDNANGEADFEALVRGGNPSASSAPYLSSDPWAAVSNSTSSSTILPSRSAGRGRTSQNASPAATFSWSSPPPMSPSGNLSAPQGNLRTITPDHSLSALNNSFPAMTPAPASATPSFTQPSRSPLGVGLGAMTSTSVSHPTTTPSYTSSNAGIDWTRASASNTSTTSIWASSSAMPSSTTTPSNVWGSSANTSSLNAWQPSSTTSSNLSSFSIAPPPTQPQSQPKQSNPYSSFSIAPPPSVGSNTGSFAIPPPPSNTSRTGIGSNQGFNMNSMVSRTNQQNNQTPNWVGGSGDDSLI